MDVPIGVINMSWCSTPAAVLVPAESIVKNKVLVQAAAKQEKSAQHTDAGLRKVWKKDFPLYFVQLAPFRYGQKCCKLLLRSWHNST